LFTLFTGVVFSQSGWVRQYPPSQFQNIRFLSVSFVDADTGFIVGGSGTILHTTNGGTEWISQLSGTMNWLRGISAASANIATAVGDSGTILRTNNGGSTWTSQSSGTAHSLRAVSFSDANTGTVVGDSGTILRTTNGGTTWMNQSSGTINNLRGVSFINSNIGTAVGDSGTILRTINGGTIWTSQLIQDINQQKDKFYGVSFTDANTGTAVGYTNFDSGATVKIEPSSGPGGIVINTTDGGITWNQQFTLLQDAVFSDSTIFGASFTDANTGTVVGLDYLGGAIWRIWTGSEGFINQSFGYNGCFYGVCFTDSITGTVVGNNGTIFHTTSGGVTGIMGNPTQIPVQFTLEQNYPNPFNPSTIISYKLAVNSFVTIKIYDILGRLVQTLVNERQSAGNHSVTFSASNLASGIYLCKMRTKDFLETRKMVYQK
jgi:photosystem II stability/assembly factor-like uncharacterized protein